MRLLVLFCWAFAALSASNAVAYNQEISFVEGGIRVNTEKSSSETDVQIGGRYAQQFSSKSYWFGESLVAFHRYTNDALSIPSHTFGAELGGGVRYYFDRWGERIFPFGVAGANMHYDSKLKTQGEGIEEHIDSGVFYGSNLGLRCSLSDAFFLDIESPLFESALAARTTKSRITENGKQTISQSDRSELALYTKQSFSSVVFSLGMRL